MNKTYKLIIKVVFVGIVLSVVFIDCSESKRGIYKDKATVDTKDLDARLDSFTGVLDKYNDSIKQVNYEKEKMLQSIESDTNNISIYNKFKQLLNELS